MAEIDHTTATKKAGEQTARIIEQSVFASRPAAAGLDLSSEIIVTLLDDRLMEYHGTHAALKAEGVIPDDIKWPEGFDDRRWVDGKFNYWLRRERPEGVKGPRKQFLSVDWWMFRCDPINSRSYADEALEKKSKALADEIYRQSSEGRAEQEKHWDDYFRANRDEKYQAFKSRIPGIHRTKPGRKAKNVQQVESSQS